MHDINQQTKKDMRSARAGCNVDLKVIRNYLYSEQKSNLLDFAMIWVRLLIVDGVKEWESHEKVVNTMKKDPIFDKSQRYFASLLVLAHASSLSLLMVM